MDWYEFIFGKWERGDGKSSFTSYFDDLRSYLLDVPKSDEQFKLQSFLYGADPTGVYKGQLDTRDVMNYWGDYFKNTGLSWSDVRYPTKMYGFGSQGYHARSGANFVSRNITRLYR